METLGLTLMYVGIGLVTYGFLSSYETRAVPTWWEAALVIAGWPALVLTFLAALLSGALVGTGSWLAKSIKR